MQFLGMDCGGGSGEGHEEVLEFLYSAAECGNQNGGDWVTGGSIFLNIQGTSIPFPCNF